MTSTSPPAPTEERPWNDPMPAWVCAIGGYEVLERGTVEDAQAWITQFGMKRHAPIRGGNFLAHELHRYRSAAHYGILYWGSPHHWEYRWQVRIHPETEASRMGLTHHGTREDWNLMLYEEQIKRDLTGADRLLIRADRLAFGRVEKRRR